MPRKLIWQIFPSHLAIELAALAGITISALFYLRGFYLKETQKNLEAIGKLAATYLSQRLEAVDDAMCRHLARVSSTRITVIMPSGAVVGDSEEDSSRMDNHADRPEIAMALAGHTANSIRFSHTLHKDMMYVAVPAKNEHGIAAVVRVSVPVQSLTETLGAIHGRLALVTLLAAALTAAVSYAISRRITQPIQQMKAGAKRLAAGDFEQKLPRPETEEMAALANAMNWMAAELRRKLHALTEERNEREAILASMREGVLAIDTDERVTIMNRAAAEMLGINESEAKGRTIQEVVRSPELQEFIAGVLSDSTPAEHDLTLRGGAERYLQLHGAALRGTSDAKEGAVIVLNDVTRLKRLEKVRQDFVANVSHELKTPVTSIKGFAETLRSGAYKEPEKAERFLDIIIRHADRLNAIIEDLLLLANLEQTAETRNLALEEADLCQVLHDAVENCSRIISERKIKVSVECEPNFVLRMNPSLIEQAVTNLIDNAVKYSNPDNTVEVSARRGDGFAEISVSDRGIGIEPDKLTRIFERFYRVDVSRSRKLGGTGLGLSIVKHIVEVHGGTVSVRSKPGEGSTFTITLPIRR